MARYNEILVGRYNRYLQKLMGMKGEPPAPQLSTEIQTSLPLAAGAEERYLQSWSLYSIGTSVTGGAGQLAASRLFNPAASGVVGVITSIWLTTTTADQVAIGEGPVAGNLTTVLTGQRLDARLRASGGAGAIVPSSDTNAGAALSPQIGTIQTLANAALQLLQDSQHEIPLLPGDAIQVTPATNAQGLRIWWMWRERMLEESEKF